MPDHEFMLPYVEQFKQNDIDGTALLSLTDAELKDDLRVHALGHRKKLLMLIDELSKNTVDVDRKGKRRMRSDQESHDISFGSTLSPTTIVSDGRQSVKRQKLDIDANPSVSKVGNAEEEKEDTTCDFTCPICFDDFHSTHDIATLSDCGHQTCVTCLRQYLQQQIDDRMFPLSCARTDCKWECNVSDVASHLSQRYLDRWEQYSLENLLKNKHFKNESEDELRFVCCPTSECKNIVLWHPEDDPHFRCEVCRKHYCLKCQCSYHHGKTCIGYKKWKIATGKDDSLFMRYISRQRVKQCPQCGMFIEKSVGCNSMVCFCGFTFCYFCGKPEATCFCGGAHHYMPPGDS